MGFVVRYGGVSNFHAGSLDHALTPAVGCLRCLAGQPGCTSDIDNIVLGVTVHNS